ncbi:MAG: hypothetical protein C0397_05445 [Odoribacter sp.]|nr:hypothetical protein [Odoribacter sp.]
MNIAKPFKEYFEASFMNEVDHDLAIKLSQDFFADFLYYTPVELDLLESYLNDGHIGIFYKSLSNLKYLVEYSDNLNRYWYLLRAYSGALSRLKSDQSVKGSKRLYLYYFNKYGERRLLRNEHWFEEKRWEFLDELQMIYTEKDLSDFVHKYHLILTESLSIYASFIKAFIKDLKRLIPDIAVLSA